MAIRRKVPDGKGDSVGQGASTETKVLLRFPLLVDHLAAVAYPDGTVRTPGFMMIYPSGRLWTVHLRDNDTDSKLKVTQETLDEALRATELLLGSEDTLWEIEQHTSKKRKGGGRK